MNDLIFARLQQANQDQQHDPMVVPRSIAENVGNLFKACCKQTFVERDQKTNMRKGLTQFYNPTAKKNVFDPTLIALETQINTMADQTEFTKEQLAEAVFEILLKNTSIPPTTYQSGLLELAARYQAKSGAEFSLPDLHITPETPGISSARAACAA